MSRSKSRLNRRRKRLELELRAAVDSARNADAKSAEDGGLSPGHGELWRLFRELNRLDLCLWGVARAVPCTEDELAMIAQAVAPHLAGKTAASVLQRREHAPRDDTSTKSG